MLAGMLLYKLLQILSDLLLVVTTRAATTEQMS